MAGRFLPQRDVNLVTRVTKELVGDKQNNKDGIINQECVIYKPSLQESVTNMYGEAAGGKKVYKNGVQMNALIDAEDFDFLRWYLVHDRASIFTDDDEWYIMIHTDCRHLRDDHLCGIYETRPQICRDYTTENCEYEDDWTYDRYFETPEQVHEYAEAVLRTKNHGSIRSPQPNPLPVIA